MFGALSNISTQMAILSFEIVDENSRRHRKLVVKETATFAEVAKQMGLDPHLYELKSADKRQPRWTDQVGRNGTYSLHLKINNTSESNESDEDQISLPSDASALDDSIDGGSSNATQQTALNMEESNQTSSRLFVTPNSSAQFVDVSLPSTSFEDQPLLNGINKSPQYGSESPDGTSTPMNCLSPNKPDLLNTTFIEESLSRNQHSIDRHVSIFDNNQIEKLQRSINQLKTIAVIQFAVIILLVFSLLFAIFYPLYATSSGSKRWV